MSYRRCLLLLAALAAGSGCYERSQMEMHDAGGAPSDAGLYAEMFEYCAKSGARQGSKSVPCSKSSLESWCNGSMPQLGDCPRTLDEGRTYVCGETSRQYGVECNSCGGLNLTKSVGIDGYFYLSFDAAGQLVGAAVSENGPAEHCDDALFGVLGTWCPTADLEHPNTQLPCK